MEASIKHSLDILRGSPAGEPGVSEVVGQLAGLRSDSRRCIRGVLP